jgi:hypothetical protein
MHWDTIEIVLHLFLLTAAVSLDLPSPSAVVMCRPCTISQTKHIEKEKEKRT